MTNRLSRVEAESLSRTNTQLDVLRVERDGLKASVARLSDQLQHARNEAKQKEVRSQQEVEHLRQKTVEKDTELSTVGKELIELRSRLAAFTEQSQSTDDSSMGSFVIW